ncbi:MAG: flavin reductase family protein [Planctomycetota bacterium]|jgi:flavin reductase (DIM6/NTAB) family NADH-FMN oxidoreductase RutF
MSDVCFESLAPGLGVETSIEFAMASQFGDAEGVIVVRRVQMCCVEPPMVAVAIRKGRPIEPIIRDARAFSLSRLDPGDVYTSRKLKTIDEHEEDPLALIRTDSLVTGMPCLSRSPAVLDCEVVRHFDLEGTHALYVGEVLAVRTPTLAHVYRERRIEEDLDEAMINASEFTAA